MEQKGGLTSRLEKGHGEGREIGRGGEGGERARDTKNGQVYYRQTGGVTDQYTWALSPSPLHIDPY